MGGELMAEFADVEDIEDRDLLTERQVLVIESLIQAAGLWIRKRRPGIADDDLAARLVTQQVVATAFRNLDSVGYTSFSRTVGGMSRSGTLANPGEWLVFTDFQRQLLGISDGLAPQYYFGEL